MTTLEYHRHDASSVDMFDGDRAASGGEARSISSSIVASLLTVARRRKWIILGALVSCLALGLIVTLLMTPKYTAFTTINIERETQSFADVQGSQAGAAAFLNQEFYQTQYGLLKSKSLAERVATDLHLYDNVAFLRLNKMGNETWFQGNRVSPAAPSREQRIAGIGGFLLGNIDIVPDRNSQLVVIKYTSPNPALAKQVVDMWAKDFIQITLERRYGTTAYARRFLEQRLEQLRSRIDESERRLVEYARRQGIVNLPGISSPGSTASERSLAADDLVTLNNERASATADRIKAASQLAAGPTNQGSAALQNGVISTLRQRRAEIASEYARLMAQFAPSYPPALALRQQINQLDVSITREEDRVRGGLNETYAAAEAREKALSAQVTNLKSGVLDLRQRSIQYNILQRDADTSRQLYDALLQRYKEIGVAGGVGVNNISIVDQAEVPAAPSSPKILVNMAAALFTGIVLGAAGAMLLEQLDQGITDPAEIENSFGTPLVGTIPTTPEISIVTAFNDRKSALYEAYLSLQTNLAFTTTHGLPRSVGVTSSRASEGKSTTSYALAQTIARAGHRVILVDVDMRSPSVHDWFEVPNKTGVSNYLTGSNDLSTLIHTSPLDNLFYMTAGPQPPSAPELLSDERMDKFLDALLADFDHVILDSPPVMGLADAPLIASRVEGVLFVLEAGSTQRETARVALNRLRAARASLLGIVLTKFDVRRSGYGYGYGYGYDYGDKNKTA